MKLSDLIDPNYSLWNTVGKTGGTALPGNNKSVKVNSTDVWKKSPPYRKKNDKRTNETVGDSTIVSTVRGRKKSMVRKSGEHFDEIIDDEGNLYLKKKNGKSVTGKISHKDMHTGANSRSLGSDVKEYWTGPGPTSGATQRPVPGSGAETTVDLDRVYDEMKGKNTKAEVRTSKKKRESFKRYLEKRAKGEIVRN